MSVAAEAVATASREWVWVPETAVTVETPEYLLARMPDWFDVQLELLRLDPERPVGDVVDEVIARARELGGPEVNCWAKLHNDPSLDAALLARGGVLDETLEELLAHRACGPLGEEPEEVLVLGCDRHGKPTLPMGQPSGGCSGLTGWAMCEPCAGSTLHP